ncbi:hypothetical protein GCM10018953_01690 [Streptosporangium nondiastaticum]
MPRRCHRHDVAGAIRLSADVVALYERCYGAPPWSETPERLRAHPTRLARSLTRPGFTAWTAHDGDRLTGVCYGRPTPAAPPGNHLHEAIIGALSLDTARRLGHAAGTAARHVTRRTSSRAADHALSRDVPDRQDPW